MPPSSLPLTVLTYDPLSIDFTPHFQALLDTPHELSSIHLHPPASLSTATCPAYYDGLQLSGVKPPLQNEPDPAAPLKGYKRRDLAISTFATSPSFLSFLSLYEQFVATVVAPIFPTLYSELVYQYPPTLRVQLGDCPDRTSGRLHSDSEYSPLQVHELNIWTPITTVSGSNTLYLESAPLAGDFAPIVMSNGSAALFWGHKCRHYITPNASPVTRVSFDLRIVPKSLRNREAEQQNDRRAHRRPNFQEWRTVTRDKDEPPATEEQVHTRNIIHTHYLNIYTTFTMSLKSPLLGAALPPSNFFLTFFFVFLFLGSPSTLLLVLRLPPPPSSPSSPSSSLSNSLCSFALRIHRTLFTP